MKNVLITGGCGFIGANFIHYLFDSTDFQESIINVDKLTYAGNPENLLDIQSKYGGKRYFFEHHDICDDSEVKRIFAKYQPDTVVNFAAESHVDRSIDGPMEFINTNIVGTAVLLQNALHYYRNLYTEQKARFRFHHVSTDEVYGSLGDEGYFMETTPYDPSSPYSASKASSDHLVRAWQRTFGLPVLITNCSNNYGPYQFPEKLIPLMILNCLAHKPLPVYGKGLNVRDWLYVNDHCEAIKTVIEKGKPGETYNIGGNTEMKNIEIVHTICDILDEIKPSSKLKTYKELITYVADRPGHDLRYAIDASKIKRELGWSPKETFISGVKKNIQWYIKNKKWCDNIIKRNS